MSTLSLSPSPALPLALPFARVARLTALALLSAAARRPARAAATVTASLARSSCRRECADAPRCAECPFARPPSE